MEPIEILWHECKRSRTDWLLIAAIVVSCAGALLLVSIWAALASALVLGTAIVYGHTAARSRVVTFEPRSRRIAVQWAPPFFGVRRKEYSLSQFDSVVSYCAFGSSMNWVCLLERQGNVGLSIAVFDMKYQYRSFWDLAPRLVEAEEARALRTKLVATLSLRDGGFSPLRWSHPKASTPAADPS